MTKEKVNLTFETIFNEYPEYDMGAEPYVYEVVDKGTKYEFKKKVAKTFLNNLENTDTQDPIRLAYLEIKGTEQEMELVRAGTEFFFDNIDSEEVFEQFKQNELRFCQWISDMSAEACTTLMQPLMKEELFSEKGKNTQFIKWVLRPTDYNEGKKMTYVSEIILGKDDIHNFKKMSNQEA